MDTNKRKMQQTKCALKPEINARLKNRAINAIKEINRSTAP